MVFQRGKTTTRSSQREQVSGSAAIPWIPPSMFAQRFTDFPWGYHKKCRGNHKKCRGNHKKCPVRMLQKKIMPPFMKPPVFLTIFAAEISDVRFPKASGTLLQRSIEAGN